MKYLSLFSGIEAATVAWHPLGWECVAVSEIEPFPCAVLAHHYPDVPNLGDVTGITESDIAALGPIDIVVAGSPCQDLSVAGHRKGLLDATGTITRSGLFYTFVNIAHWARKHCGCRFMLWENVPGAFSSNKGRDFASVVEFMAGLDDVPVPAKGWGTEGIVVGDDALVEWCVLDAQWFGVAQRRRRVFALADFGDWASRPPILLEPEGMRGDSAPSREARQVAPIIPSRSLGGGGLGTDFDCDGGLIQSTFAIQGTLIGRGENAGPQGLGADGSGAMFTLTKTDIHAVAHTLRGEGFDASEDGTGRGTARMHKGINSTLDEGQTPVIAYPINTQIATRCEALGEGTGFGIGADGDPGFTLQAAHGHAVAIAFHPTQDPIHSSDGTVHAMGCGSKGGCATQAVAMRESGQGYWMEDVVAGTIDANMGMSGHANRPAVIKHNAMQVRRLTPRECERLQGFSPVLEILRIEGCTDHQKKAVHVEIGSHRLQCNAWNAAEKEYLQFASTAKAGSHTPQASHVLHVALYARRHYAESPLVLLSAGGELKSNASSAADQSWSRSRIDTENFAALLAPHWESLVKEAAHGKAASQQSIRLSLEARSGNQSATKFGGVIAECASDAIADASAEKSITSHPGRVMPTCDSPTATSLCSVMNAINSCIQNGILSGSFCVDLVLERDYTAVPYRNKPACDGPRYKALGNSMAVPVMRWIGERVDVAVRYRDE